MGTSHCILNKVVSLHAEVAVLFAEMSHNSCKVFVVRWQRVWQHKMVLLQLLFGYITATVLL